MTGIDESALTKGQLRKLNALRKSVGEDVGERAFAAWLESQKGDAGEADGNAVQIVDVLWPLVEEGRLAIPRGGYLLRDAAAGGSSSSRQGRSGDSRFHAGGMCGRGRRSCGSIEEGAGR